MRSVKFPNLPEYSAKRLWCTSIADRCTRPAATVMEIGMTNDKVHVRSPLILRRTNGTSWRLRWFVPRVTHWLSLCLWSMSGSLWSNSRSNGGNPLMIQDTNHIKLENTLDRSVIRLYRNVKKQHMLTSPWGRHGLRNQKHHCQISFVSNFWHLRRSYQTCPSFVVMSRSSTHFENVEQ